MASAKKQERDAYTDIIVLFSVLYSIRLKRIHDGGFQASGGKFISAKKGTDFIGWHKITGRSVVVEAKKDSDSLPYFSKSRRKELRQSQIAWLNECSEENGIPVVVFEREQGGFFLWLWPIEDSAPADMLLPLEPKVGFKADLEKIVLDRKKGIK